MKAAPLQAISADVHPSSRMIELAYDRLPSPAIGMDEYEQTLRSAIRNGLALLRDTRRVVTKSDARDLRLYLAYRRGLLTQVRGLHAAELAVGVRDGQGNLLEGWR